MTRGLGRAAFTCLLFVPTFVAACDRASSAPLPAPTPARSAAHRDATTLDALVDRERARARVPAIAYATVSETDAIVGAVGLAAISPPREATADSTFEAASIGKTIIGVCAMQLVAEGRLDLDADVSRYLAMRVTHPKHRRAITARMLLMHTSSILDDLDALQADARVPLGDFLERYLRGPVYDEGEPGTKMRYSNAGAALAALVVENISGQSFDELAHARVFVPLAMTSTSFRAEGRRAPASGHAARDGGFVTTRPASHAVYPVVDLHSSARDLARFARAILRGGELDGARILPQGAVDAMLRLAPPGDALGWQVRTFGRFEVVGHEGEDEGASTALYLDRRRGAGAVVLANGDAFGSEDPRRAQALSAVVEALLGAAPSRAGAPRVSSIHAD